MQFRIRSQNNHSIHYKMANYGRKKRENEMGALPVLQGYHIFICIDPNEQLFDAKKVSIGIFNETHTNI